MPGNQQNPPGYWARMKAAARGALRQTLFRVLDERHWQMAASLAAAGLGMYHTYRIVEEHDAEDIGAHAGLAVANLGLLTYAMLQHPGTVGDAQVAPAAQRSVASVFRSSLTDEWSPMRWGLNLLLLPAPMLTGGITGQVSTFNRVIAGGAGMLSYATELSAPQARFYRANPVIVEPGARQNDYFMAGLLYFLVYLMHTMQGIAISLNITYLLKLAEGDPEFSHTTLPGRLFPHVAGTAINHATMAILVTFQGGRFDSPANRVKYSGLPRLIARLVARAYVYGWDDAVWLLNFSAYDLVDAASAHRWFKEPAKRYRSGITMDRDHALARFGGSGNESLLLATKPARFIYESISSCRKQVAETLQHGAESKTVAFSGVAGSPVLDRLRRNGKYGPPPLHRHEFKQRGPREGLLEPPSLSSSSASASPASGRPFNPSPSSLFTSTSGPVPGRVVLIQESIEIPAVSRPLSPPAPARQPGRGNPHKDSAA